MSDKPAHVGQAIAVVCARARIPCRKQIPDRGFLRAEPLGPADTVAYDITAEPTLDWVVGVEPTE